MPSRLTTRQVWWYERFQRPIDDLEEAEYENAEDYARQYAALIEDRDEAWRKRLAEWTAMVRRP